MLNAEEIIVVGIWGFSRITKIQTINKIAYNFLTEHLVQKCIKNPICASIKKNQGYLIHDSFLCIGSNVTRTGWTPSRESADNRWPVFKSETRKRYTDSKVSFSFVFMGVRLENSTQLCAGMTICVGCFKSFGAFYLICRK